MTPVHDPINDDAWMDHAGCLGEDPNLFFPQRGQDPTPAKRICAACVVRDECLDHAMQWSLIQGIWGGKSERERRRMRAASKQAAA